MKCDECAAEIAPGDARGHAGRTLCEDCYLDVLSAPRACDPWAVYSATRTATMVSSANGSSSRWVAVLQALLRLLGSLA